MLFSAGRTSGESGPRKKRWRLDDETKSLKEVSAVRASCPNHDQRAVTFRLINSLSRNDRRRRDRVECNASVGECFSGVSNRFLDGDLLRRFGAAGPWPEIHGPCRLCANTPVVRLLDDNRFRLVGLVISSAERCRENRTGPCSDGLRLLKRTWFVRGAHFSSTERSKCFAPACIFWVLSPYLPTAIASRLSSPSRLRSGGTASCLTCFIGHPPRFPTRRFRLRAETRAATRRPVSARAPVRSCVRRFFQNLPQLRLPCGSLLRPANAASALTD